VKHNLPVYCIYSDGDFSMFSSDSLHRSTESAVCCAEFYADRCRDKAPKTVKLLHFSNIFVSWATPLGNFMKFL